MEPIYGALGRRFSYGGVINDSLSPFGLERKTGQSSTGWREGVQKFPFT
jgi:hypothetical protein